MVGFLSLSWLGVLIYSALNPMGVTGKPIANTGNCIEVKPHYPGDPQDLFPLYTIPSCSWQPCLLFISKSKLEVMVWGKYLLVVRAVAVHGRYESCLAGKAKWNTIYIFKFSNPILLVWYSTGSKNVVLVQLLEKEKTTRNHKSHFF